MTKRIPYAILAFVLVSTAAAQQQKAQDYLNQSREGVLAAVKGLSEAQWNFKTAPDRWSIAEIVEHITVTEGLVVNLLSQKLPAAPAPPAGFDAVKVDAMILSKMPDRSTKAKAPEEIQPTGRWSPEETLRRFVAANQQLGEALRNTPDLRQHVFPHPAFGPLDGYEWVLAAAGHNVRHTGQIQEVKADPNFPR